MKMKESETLEEVAEIEEPGKIIGWLWDVETINRVFDGNQRTSFVSFQ